MDLFEYREAYPLAAGFKRRDTAVAAAEAVTRSGRAALLRDKVLDVLRRGGPMTADEAAAAIDEDILSVRPRCSELANMGLIRDSGERRMNERSGKRAVVWVVA